MTIESTRPARWWNCADRPTHPHAHGPSGQHPGLAPRAWTLLACKHGNEAATYCRLTGLRERSRHTRALPDRGRLPRGPGSRLPDFVRELLAQLVESVRSTVTARSGHGSCRCRARGAGGLRHVIGQRVARLLERLGSADRRGCCGQTFSLSVLEGVVREASGLLDGLDEAVAAGLLTEAGWAGMRWSTIGAVP
jgi:hypothetical protein